MNMKEWQKRTGNLHLALCLMSPPLGLNPMVMFLLPHHQASLWVTSVESSSAPWVHPGRAKAPRSTLENQTRGVGPLPVIWFQLLVRWAPLRRIVLEQCWQAHGGSILYGRVN